MKFWKTQAVGNDFVLVHESDLPSTHSMEDWARALCDRHRGVGSDGLLVMRPGHLRMFNPDGSEDFCGNGLRCATVHAYHQGWMGSDSTLIHHGREVYVRMTGASRARVMLPAAEWDPIAVPHLRTEEIFQSLIELPGGGELVCSSLSTGSTHSVVFIDELPSDEAFLSMSRELEHHPLFPDRTSVMWAKPVHDRTLNLRIWERGAGETLGCGTGSVATAVAWARLRGLSGEFSVGGPGGPIAVHLDHWTGPIEMESDVETVFTGDFSPAAVEAVLVRG